MNLLLADDVGLGKTIEAGLVALELMLRHRAERIMIICPAGLTTKWRDEMAEKFGLDFSRLVAQARPAAQAQLFADCPSPTTCPVTAGSRTDWISAARRCVAQTNAYLYSPRTTRRGSGVVVFAPAVPTA